MMARNLSRWLRAVGAAVVLAILAAPPASATFPGKNGLIAYSAPVYTGPGGTCGPEEIPCDDSVSRIFTLNAPEKQEGVLFPTCSTADCGDYEPDWSPDGRQLAFSRGGPGVAPRIFIAMADGSTPRAIALGQSPAWSPDGRRLAYQRNNTQGRSLGLFIVDVLTGAQRRLTFARSDGEPDWSVRGLIAFTRYSKVHRRLELWTVRSGQRAVRLASAHGSSPDWSPDGKRVALQARSRGKYRGVWLASRDAVRRLTRTGSNPFWAPDGTRIGLVTRQGIVSVRTSGPARKQVLTPAGARFPDWQSIR